LRTGKDPTGRPISDIMPWRTVGKMDDEDLTAIYQYLAHSFQLSRLCKKGAGHAPHG